MKQEIISSPKPPKNIVNCELKLKFIKIGEDTAENEMKNILL